MHTARRDEGELSVERFGELWADTQTDDARRLGRDHRGLPHVVVVHPALHRDARATCTRTRTASCSRCRCTRSTRRAAPTSCRSTSTCCAPAARWRPRSSASSSTSTSPTPGSGTAASTSSSAASTRRSKPPRPREGLSMTVSRHPVEHRQRRPWPRCGASSAIPTSSSSGCGCTRPTRPAGTRGSCAGSPPTGVLATNDADALLALDADCVSYTATADLRPTDAINDMARILASGKNVVSSSVVAAGVAAAPRAGDARRRSKTRAATAGVSCFTSGIDPGLGERHLAAAAHRHVRERRAPARDGDRQLQALRAADGAVRHDGLRPGARREAVAVDPGRAVVRVGRRR